MQQDVISAEVMFEELRKRHNFEIFGQGKIKIDGMKFFSNDKLWDHLRDEIQDICRDLGQHGLFMLNSQVPWVNELVSKIFLTVNGEKPLSERPEEMVGMKLCQKLGENGYFVYDEDSETIFPEDTFNEENYKTKLGSELANAERDDVMDVVSVFHPNREKSWLAPYNLSETRVWNDVRWVNEYRYPAYHSLPDLRLPLPGDVETVFNHVFEGDKNTIHQVKSWIHNALTRRCQNYLVLSGAPAVGKTLLLDDILRAIMGRAHSASAPTGFHNDKWNTILENRVYLYYDEGGLDNSTKLARAKEYANLTQTPVTKFVNSVKSIRNHTSQAFSCNKDQRFVFEPDDRKFYCPDLTDSPLGTVLTEEQISGMKDKLENDLEYQAQVGFYFRNYKTDINPFTTAIKTKTFWRLHDEGVTGFREWLLAEFRNVPYETVMYPKQLAKDYKKFDKRGQGGSGRSNGFHPNIRVWLKLMSEMGRPVVEISFQEQESFIKKEQPIEIFRSLICEETTNDVSDDDLDDL